MNKLVREQNFSPEPVRSVPALSATVGFMKEMQTQIPDLRALRMLAHPSVARANDFLSCRTGKLFLIGSSTSK
jgi:hypothetical protein